MTIPARAIAAVRPQASPGVLGGAAVVAAVFAATTFLLPSVASELNLPIGVTGLLSTAQVASFALAAFLAGRLLRPRRRLHYGGLLLAAVASLASGLAPNFGVLLATLFVSGLGLGTLTWIAWADATRFTRGLGDVAAIAPVTAAVVSPIIGWVIQHGGYRTVYLALGGLALLALFLPVDFGDLPRIGRKVSGSRSNLALLAGLAILSVGGSGVFIFTAATAASVQGLSPAAMSWAVSINAVFGVVATRLTARRGTAWLWLIGCAIPTLTIGVIASQMAFFVAMVIWGFAFWMAVPAIFRMLAERSITPSERVGDAQAVMAIGRVLGPVVGGLALGSGQFARLSVIGAVITVGAVVIVASVERVRARTGPVA